VRNCRKQQLYTCHSYLQHAHNEEEGTRTWHFLPTPPMSTYLGECRQEELADTLLAFTPRLACSFKGSAVVAKIVGVCERGV
jgi:hypothetical protein